MRIETNLIKRWEDGVPHDERSRKLFLALADIDYQTCGDYFCWKYGGDGDNGEVFMFQLDVYFQRLDAGIDCCKPVTLGAQVGKHVVYRVSGEKSYHVPEECPACSFGSCT